METVLFLEKLAYTIMIFWAGKYLLEVLLFSIHMSGRNRRREQYEAWIKSRVNGTWWEKQNAGRHMMRILREGYNTEYKGPWEDD